MGYSDQYQKYLDQIPSDIEKCKESGKRMVIGYTSDADALLTYSEDAFNEVVEKFLNCEPYHVDGDMLNNMSDFARFVASHMIQGIGGEADITSQEVVDYLLEHFEYKYSLGGTCAQGSAALTCIGMPVLCQISDTSKEVCSMMDYPGLDTVIGDEVVHLADHPSGDPVYHLIFSYNKGDKFKIGEKEYVVPVANRLILDFDTMHKDILVREDFKAYLEKNAKKMVSYNISGFNAITDVELTKKRMDELHKHYDAVKKENPDCIIYFESAHYLSPEVKYLVYQEVSQYVNILSMNEEELVAHTEEHAISIDKESLGDVIRGMDVIIDKYRVNGIVMHTKDYAMYYGSELKGIDIEKGLTLGNLLSGTRARVGHYGSLEEARESLQFNLSETGLRFAEELEHMDLKGKQAVLVPSRYLEKPVTTIGLGDTFAAGVQYAFIR